MFGRRFLSSAVNVGGKCTLNIHYFGSHVNVVFKNLPTFRNQFLAEHSLRFLALGHNVN